MKKLSRYTKLEPIDRIKRTNEFLSLFSGTEKDPDDTNKISSKEKCELYGIEVKPYNKLFNAYYMEEPRLYGGNNKKIYSKDRTFPALIKCDMTKWVCFYEKSYHHDAESLYYNLNKASKAFELKIAEPQWIELEDNSSVKDWTDIANDYFDKNKSDYYFAVFLLGKNDNIYIELKKNSLCNKGYVSQIVKVKSLKKKGVMSVCSKILLQINAKLGGISYKIIHDKIIQNRKFMIIGVYSSHIKGKGTGVGMVATINDSFSNFFNKETIIKEENNRELFIYSINNFIENAIKAYKEENKELPKNIIIYRQGVSLQQKEYLKTEAQQINFLFKSKSLLYYYILVNTKTNFKFFEKAYNSFEKPSSGLLVIDGVTNRNFFEFYIQPQEVEEGTAIPTCFHVAFGDLNFPELIPKITYDLCHIYCNWQGIISVPNVIKVAEKLSKMTIKYTNLELNENLEKGQVYL